MPKPQLPEIINTSATSEEEMIKSKPQINTTTTAESLSTEIPSAEISSGKREWKATAIDETKLAKEKNR